MFLYCPLSFKWGFLMPTPLEKQYKSVLEKLKLKAANMPHNPSSGMKTALPTFIQLVEQLKTKDEVSLEHLTEALDSTHDLLEGRIDLTRYQRVANCMLSSVPPKNGTSLLGICMHYLSAAVFWVSLVTLFIGPTIPAVLGLIASFFLSDLQKYIDSGQPKKEPSSTPLSDGMRLFSINVMQVIL